MRFFKITILRELQSFINIKIIILYINRKQKIYNYSCLDQKLLQNKVNPKIE